jgi:hypothetical protein
MHREMLDGFSICCILSPRSSYPIGMLLWFKWKGERKAVESGLGEAGLAAFLFISPQNCLLLFDNQR